MRPAIVALFMVLFAIPVAQVTTDWLQSGRLHIWNWHVRSDALVLSKHQRSKSLDVPVVRPDKKKTG